MYTNTVNNNITNFNFSQVKNFQPSSHCKSQLFTLTLSISCNGEDVTAAEWIVEINAFLAKLKASENFHQSLNNNAKDGMRVFLSASTSALEVNISTHRKGEIFSCEIEPETFGHDWILSTDAFLQYLTFTVDLNCKKTFDEQNFAVLWMYMTEFNLTLHVLIRC